MHIIFGDDQAQALADKYTVLELDTLRFGANGPVATAYCVIEQIAINDLPKVESMRNLHSELMVNYRKRDWNFCTQALEHLTGFWGKELDSFYINLSQRITTYQEQDPGEDWDGIVEKQVAQ